ncbi:MAG: SIMPL domain-containing protein [Clostridia bacterium]|nr:SIMPL domain-containing protein [Clostridia bacterium]
MKKTIGRTFVAILLAGALLLCAAPTSLASGNDAWAALLDRTVTAIGQLTAESGELTVTGTASIAVEPDKATIMLGVSIADASVSAAQEKANITIQTIIDSLTALGIDQSKMSTNNYSVYPTYDYSQEPAAVNGYQVNNMLTVQVSEFALISQVIDRAVQAGANQVHGLTFDTSRRSELYRDALQSAIGAAREKAALMALATGKQLGDLRSVTEDGQIGFYSSNVWDTRSEAEMGGAQILGGELDVTARVTLVFELK